MRKILHNYFLHGRNWLGTFLVLAFVIVAVFAPVFSPADPNKPGNYKIIGDGTDVRPQSPSPTAPLGTISRGISVYHSIIWGTRDALKFGLLVTLCVAFIGIIFGGIAGYAGGAVNRLMMRVSDAFLTFPVIASIVFLEQIRVILLDSVGGPWLVLIAKAPGFDLPPLTLLQSTINQLNTVMFSLILFSWMPYARLMNTMVISLKQTEFVLAAQSIGMKPSRILFRHIIPNAISPALVLAARDVGAFVILQATFTFIGLGGNSVWGTILTSSRDWIIGPNGNIFAYWWTFIPATLVVILFGITWNLFGDGLGELMDPFTRYHKG